MCSWGMYMLTQKKLLFAKGVIEGKNQKQSAIDAGYSAKFAEITGSKLARDKDVLAYIKRYKEERWANRTPNPMTELLKDEVNEPECQEAVPQPKVKIGDREYDDPLEILEEIMNDKLQDPRVRVDAAKKLADLAYSKTTQKHIEDKKKPASKFASAPPPLKAVK